MCKYLLISGHPARLALMVIAGDLHLIFENYFLLDNCLYFKISGGENKVVVLVAWPIFVLSCCRLQSLDFAIIYIVLFRQMPVI